MTYLYPLILGVPFYFLLIKLKFNYKPIWDKSYAIIFHTVTLAFALIHIPTLEMDKANYLYLPILIIPFYILGVSFGYIRNRLGVIYAILLHFIFNAPVIVITLLKFK
jgi:hypothetical protein